MQVDLWIWGQPDLEFQDSQGYAEKPHLEKPKTEKEKKGSTAPVEKAEESRWYHDGEVMKTEADREWR